MRLLIIIVAILPSVALLGAAGMLGRATGQKLAVVQIAELLRSDIVTYGLVDLDHGFFMQRSIDVPGFAGSDFRQFPPLVLQSTPNEDTTIWTLNALDVWSGALMPEMRIEADKSIRLNVTMFRQQAGDRWIYRDFFEALLYVTRAGEIDGERRQEVSGALTFWSSDYTRLAAETAGVVTITDFETGETDVIMQGARPQARMEWSPNSRSLAVSSLNVDDVIWNIIDVESREVAAEIKADALSWCDDHHLYYTAERGDGLYEARMYDLEAGKEDVFLARDLSNIPVSARVLALLHFRDQPCDWLQLFTGTETAGRETVEVVHVESGATIPFSGRLLQLYNIADGVLTYLVEEGVEDEQKTELRRIILDPSTEGHEVLVSLDVLNTSLTWIDDKRGAVHLRNGQLRRIEPETGKEILLPGAEILAFSIMP